jgi:hypothetical protein
MGLTTPEAHVKIGLNLKKKLSLAFRPKAIYTTARPPLVSEIYCQILRIEGCRVVSAADPQRSLISVF